MKRPTKKQLSEDYELMKREYEKRYNIYPYDLGDEEFTIKTSCKEYKKLVSHLV